MTSRRAFLTATWRDLAMLNFVIEPRVLRPFLPAATELDTWQGQTFVSVVGFRFCDLRVLGVRVPLHQEFEEVNLRFYVRRKTDDGWRRGVVFIKELVPRSAVTFAARTFYGENYHAVPMSHRIERGESGGQATHQVTYRWQFNGRDQSIDVTTIGESRPIDVDSHEAFIAEQFWGYTRRSETRTLEYEVEHPPWRTWPAQQARLTCDVANLYGQPFVEALTAAPTSAFLADGSDVTVYYGTKLA
jgi:uncharacterized protein YqjF (DUF2071 family)